MANPLNAVTTVDAYIAAAPAEARAMLEQLRAIIRSVAPEARETISYRMPFYRHGGRPLVGFAAFKHHCGLYGSNEGFLKSDAGALERYVTSPGTVRFPIGKPLPVSLIKKLVKARMQDHKTN